MEVNDLQVDSPGSEAAPNSVPQPVPITAAAPLPTRSAAPGRSSTRRHRRGLLRQLPKRIGKLLKWQVVLVVVLIALIIPGAAAAAFVTDANARVQDSWGSLRRVLTTLRGRSLTELSQADITRLQFSVDALSSDLARARQQTAFLRPIAAVQPNLKARLELLDIGLEIGQAAQDTLGGLRPTLLQLLPSDKGQSATLQLGASERIAELLRVGQGRFQNASQHLATAQSKLDALSLFSLSPDLLLTVQEITQYQQQFDSFNKILIDGPDIISTLLGLNDGQDYLILSQNSDEIRPSGGYISTFGYMRIRRAQIIDFGYSPTTATSPNPPPDTLLDQLKIPSWWIQYKNPIYTAWDGSWYADFPSTAKMAAWFYDNGLNPRSPVKGVIGIDIAGFEYLLGTSDGVKVPGYDDTVTASNFRDVIYKIREGEGDAPHKQFLAALYKQILTDWQAASQDHADKLFSAVVRALQEKHIMLYFTDPKLDQAVGLLGWSGAQPPTHDHDYLMVADTNLGNKSNRSIARQLTYDVEIQPDGSLKSRASIDYDYSAAVAAKDPAVNPRNYTDINYYNTMQVFVPAGVTSVETKNLQSKVDTVAGPNNTDFVTLTEVKFDSTQRYQFSYTTPVLVQTFGGYRRYRLLLQKQPGMLGESAEVQVTLPAGASIISALPAPTASYDLGQPVAVFRTQLITDQWIDIVYKK